MRLFLIRRPFLTTSYCGSCRFLGVSKNTPVSKTESEKHVRGISGYNLFFKEVLPRHKEVGSSFAEAAKAAAAEWRTMSESIRQKYNAKAASLNPPRASKKAPPTAYTLFYKSVYPSVAKDHPDASFGEKSRLIADIWKTMDSKEKTRRRDLAIRAFHEFKAKQLV